MCAVCATLVAAGAAAGGYGTDDDGNDDGAAGDDLRVIDCNGGYSLEDDHEFLCSLDQYELAMIEQPLCPTTGGNAGKSAIVCDCIWRLLVDAPHVTHFRVLATPLPCLALPCPALAEPTPPCAVPQLTSWTTQSWRR